MSAPRPRGVLVAWLAAAVAGAALVPLGARAATLSMTSASMGADTGSVQSCGTITNISLRSGYVASRYQVTSVELGAVPAACFGQTYRLTLFDVTNNASYLELTGLLPATPSASLPVVAGAGPNLANVHSQVGVTMVVTP